MEVRFFERKKRKISKNEEQKGFFIENLGGEMIQMET